MTATEHPWRVVLTWAVLTVAAFLVASAGVGGPSLFSKLSTGEPTAPGEALTGRDLLAAAEPDRAAILLTVDGVDLTSPAVASAVTAATGQLTAIDGVADTASPFGFPAGSADPRAAAFVASGGAPAHAFLIVTHLRSDLTSTQRKEVEHTVRAAYTRLGATLPGTQIAIGSGSALGDEIIGQMESDLRLGEGIALPLSFALMVLVFGGFVAAGMPIIGAVVSIGGALAALYGFSTVMDLDASTVNVVTLLGLALSSTMDCCSSRGVAKSSEASPTGGPRPSSRLRRSASRSDVLPRPRGGRCCSPGSRWRSRWQVSWCSGPPPSAPSAPRACRSSSWPCSSGSR